VSTLSLIIGCRTRPAQVEPSLLALPTFEQFRATQRSIAFVASPERRATLLASVASVHVGSPAFQVRSALGPPDFATVLVPKQSTHSKGTEWVYLVSSQNLDAVNEKTAQAVVVYFGPDYRVSRIYRRNL
jgi:hypothetical protein